MSYRCSLSYREGYQETKSYSYPVMFFTCIILSLSFSAVSGSDFWFLHQYVRQHNQKFEQRTSKFWEFQEESNNWVEVQLPYDLVSCVNNNCTKVGSIGGVADKTEEHENGEFDAHEQKDITKKEEKVKAEVEENTSTFLPLRKRISLTKMSDTSVWITGPSGSIYERFWNGLQWVIAPHDLPVLAGNAISVFIVNQTIFALSEAGNLYQMQLNENSLPIWVDCTPVLDQGAKKKTEQSSSAQLVLGVTSEDKERMYFCTKSGSLLELIGISPPRWKNHGRPPGANVAAIVDTTSFRQEVIFTASDAGDLYAYDPGSKPAWMKHIQKEGSAKDISLAPSKGCSFQGPNGASPMSLFLLTKEGKLVERQFHQRKWKWIVHESPKNHFLTSITCASQEEQNDITNTIFLTTAAGLIFEYQISKHSGTSQENQILGKWTNHIHPPHAKVARDITGLQLQVGRMIFPLDDGRLAELHLPGTGGEYSDPNHQANFRRKASVKYVWSILDAPETEGWNAEYCTEERGPMNCISGMKDELIESDLTSSLSRRRKANNAKQIYLPTSASCCSSTKSTEDYRIPDNWITKNFRLRVMQGSKSFFLITDNGLIFEYLNAENIWFWLRHDHSTAIKGAVGNYNGSLFLIDEHGSVLIRERSSNELAWINCTAMRKGRQVIGGRPWDGSPGKTSKVTADDAIFFVSKSGRLLQLTVALRKFKWKDCRNPPNTKIACIVDQEVLRENIVFITGRDGRLYQYNKVTELWHEHLQSQHLVLSRFSGTAMRSTSGSLKGSLFMISESGGLVEYHWNALDSWNWVEHGTPNTNVALVGAPGPCFGGSQLLLIGSDGKVYLRYIEEGTWKWKNCGFPYLGNKVDEDERMIVNEHEKEEICFDKDYEASFHKIAEDIQAIHKNCDPKVESTRPIPFEENSVIFELRDGRLAEMRQNGEANWEWSRIIGTPTSSCLANWEWSRIIGTPTSSCLANYWTALAS